MRVKIGHLFFIRPLQCSAIPVRRSSEGQVPFRIRLYLSRRCSKTNRRTISVTLLTVFVVFAVVDVPAESGEVVLGVRDLLERKVQPSLLSAMIAVCVFTADVIDKVI